MEISARMTRVIAQEPRTCKAKYGNADGNNVLVIAYMLGICADDYDTSPQEKEYIKSDFSCCGLRNRKIEL
jgi:hypothetical protein